jgi:periplasmic protein CpxP/Spy
MAIDGVKSDPATQGAAPGRLRAIKLRFFSANRAAGLQRTSNMARLFAAASVVLACVTIATASQITSAGVPLKVLLPQAQTQPPAQPPNVETNIESLHQRLQITPAQEAQFNAVANVMRQNARAEATAPQPPPANASAVESLRAEIQYDEMELAEMKRFLPALEALYATLSPAQRQTADAILRQGPGG